MDRWASGWTDECVGGAFIVTPTRCARESAVEFKEVESVSGSGSCTGAAGDGSRGVDFPEPPSLTLSSGTPSQIAVALT